MFNANITAMVGAVLGFFLGFASTGLICLVTTGGMYIPEWARTASLVAILGWSVAVALATGWAFKHQASIG